MNTRLSPISFLRHCADVASFYGFKPMREIEMHTPGRRGRGGFHSFTTSVETCAQCVVGQKIAEPILTYYVTTAPTHTPSHLSPREVGEFGLHVVGSPESLGEILLLKTLFSIVTEWGGRVASVRVNALGEKESRARFERELVSYVRRHQHELCETCKIAIAQNPLSIYRCTEASCKTIVTGAPRAMSFLSEKSRAHFREVLEYIESVGLPYEVDDLLVGDEREPRVVFALDLAEEDATIVAGSGGRYDEYLKKILNQKNAAVVSASMYFRKRGVNRSHIPQNSKAGQPSVYFVQLGTRAKLQGLMVVDMLRAAQVPVAQSFDAHNLGSQLQSARDRGVKHLLIMGQREALDGTIIVRSMQNASQQVVPLSNLPRLLKGLR